MALTPKRLFLYLCISISLLRPYTLFSRSTLVNKTLFENACELEWVVLYFKECINSSLLAPTKIEELTTGSDQKTQRSLAGNRTQGLASHFIFISFHFIYLNRIVEKYTVLIRLRSCRGGGGVQDRKKYHKGMITPGTCSTRKGDRVR